MNVPAVVKKTFEALRERPEYLAIMNAMKEALKTLPDPIQRARLVHQVVDDYNVPVFSNPLVKDLMPCSKGCAACCHTQVSVTSDEAKLLLLRIDQGVTIDEKLLRRQMQAGNDHDAYYEIPYAERRCIFLDEQGSCRVYDDRPSVCRTNAVLGRPEQCETSVEILPTRLVNTPNADMAIYAHYSSAESSGTLPYMVGELLAARALVD